MKSFCLVLLGFVFGHMEIQSPAPRRSKFSKYYRKTNNVDWDLNTPLGSVKGYSHSYPCRGSAQGPAQAVYRAGDIINVQFEEVDRANFHSGGHCQFGLSYDNGKNIVVLSTIIRRCFLDGLNFPVKIPELAPPSNKTVLSWTWINAVGNREYYMNCVDIKITGGKVGGSITGPENLIGNLPNYPFFPEFYMDDLSYLFKKRTVITIQA